MIMLEESFDLLKCTLGEESPLNIAGKIIFLPLIIYMFLIWISIQILLIPFTKRNKMPIKLEYTPAPNEYHVFNRILHRGYDQRQIRPEDGPIPVLEDPRVSINALMKELHKQIEILANKAFEEGRKYEREK